MRAGLLAVILMAGLVATPALSQTVQFEGVTVTASPAPQDDAARTRADGLAREGLQAKIVYVEKFDGTIQQKAPAKQTEAPRDPLLSGLPALILIVLLLAGLMALWVYFGGGALLASDTAEPKKKAVQAPEGWGQSMADLGGGGSLAEIAAMTDRRAALVRLLRLCLLTGAEATETGFKRSDTEREAYRRLPDRWPGLEYLKRLLVSAELAHYGGRAVDEADFHALIDGARRIMAGQRGNLV